MVGNQRIYGILSRLTGLCLCIGLGLCACNDKNSKEGLPKIDLEKAISIGKTDKLDRKDWKVETVQLAETDSTMLGYIQLAGVKDDNVWVFDEERVYRFAKDGECVTVLDKHGAGPGEYRVIIDAVILPENRILLSDAWAMNFYSEQGNFLTSVNKNHVKSLLSVDKELLALGFGLSEEHGDSVPLYWMDDNASVMSSILLHPDNVGNGALYFTVLQEFDGRPAVLSADTIFSLAKIGEKIPELTFHTGKLALPVEVAGDWDRADERAKYIMIYDALVWNNYVFVTYGYDSKGYFDVWHMTDCTLLFRNMVANVKEGAGMPLETSDGRIVRVWPAKVTDGKLVGIIMPDLQLEETSEDSNPGVFIISKE